MNCPRAWGNKAGKTPLIHHTVHNLHASVCLSVCLARERQRDFSMTIHYGPAVYVSRAVTGATDTEGTEASDHVDNGDTNLKPKYFLF